MPPTPQTTTWLAKLTLAQLRRVAFAIGAPSSGTKPVLTRQIQHELQCASASATAAAAHRKGAQNSNTNGGAATTFLTSPGLLSVVSIDMGIRNLAYSHLVVDVERRLATSFGDGENFVEQHQHQQRPTSRRPILLAWKRVVISGGTPVGNGNSNGKGVSSSTTTKKRTKEQRISDEVLATTTTPPPAAAEEPTTTATADVSPPSPPTAVDKEAFDPSTLANHAYTFIKNIVLAAHPPPTHVLIERQRFRSGGGSAVQEWTIRVGVFEGMLHAVLRTLAAERRLDVVVQGVDPGRVTRYWLESRRMMAVAAAQGGRESVRRSSSAKESKKAKIDIVGASLGCGNGSTDEGGLVDIGADAVDVGGSGGQVLAGSSSSTTTTTTTTSQRDDRGRQDAVQETVNAFVARWKKTTSTKPNSRGRRKGEDPAAAAPTTNGPLPTSLKLDDLADCLLQGVAWLEWQSKRHEVLHQGLEAFAEDPLFAASFLASKSKSGSKGDGAGTGKRKKGRRKKGEKGESR